jgi:hypothetical protein
VLDGICPQECEVARIGMYSDLRSWARGQRQTNRRQGLGLRLGRCYATPGANNLVVGATEARLRNEANDKRECHDPDRLVVT